MSKVKCFLWKVCAFFLFMVFIPQPAFAYIGPGAGLSAIGAFLAVIAAVIVAIFGFLWYPIKRFLKKKKNTQNREAE